MADQRVDQLFRSPTFRADLPDIVSLGEPVLSGIIDLLRNKSLPGTPDAAELAQRTGASEELLVKALSLSTFWGNVLQNEEEDVDELIGRIQEVVGSDFPGLSSYTRHLRDLQGAGGALTALKNRRTALESGGPTISSMSVVCDLRLITATPPPMTTGDLENYRPEIVELLPVVHLKFSFASFDDGEDCSIQLTASELKQLIVQLQAAERQLHSASASVQLLSQTHRHV